MCTALLSTIVLPGHRIPRFSSDNAFFPSTEDSDEEDEPAPAEPT